MKNSSEILVSHYLPSGRVTVIRLVDHALFENVTRLLGNAFAKVLVVNLDFGDVTGVARDDSRLPLSWTLLGPEEHRRTVMIKL